MKRKVYKLLKKVYKFLFNKYTDQDKVHSLLRKIIRRKIKDKEAIYFIQIGANDGKTGDPFYELVLKYNLKGILVEPVPYLFERLKSNYKDQSEVVFENAAIGNPERKLKFYRLEETPGLPIWHNQIGSFRKEVVLRHEFAIPNIKELILEEDVNIISFDDLLKKYNLSYVTILFIDTEGYDGEIIRSINFSKCSIDCILFEFKHLSEVDYFDTMKYLRENGFNYIIEYEGDTLCSKYEL